MGNTDSRQVRSEGKIDGRSVRFEIRGEAEDEAELVWTELEDKDGPEHRLGAKDIIATLPVHAQLPNDYSVLYVEPNEASQHDKKASPVVFKSLIATNLPQAFIHAFQPPGDACWQIRHDKSDSLPNLHIVVSVGSGTGQALSVWEQLLKPMLQHVCPGSNSFALHVTNSETSIIELTQNIFLPQANAGVTQAIVLMSGDGGIVDLVNALIGEGKRGRDYRRPNVALLPLGTGNALANSARITADNTLGLKSLLQGSAKELPLFRAWFSSGSCLLTNEGRDERPLEMFNGVPAAHGAVVASWGLHATLVADSDTTEYRKFGAERFGMAAKESLYPSDGSQPHAFKGKVMIQRSSPNLKDEWQTIPRESHGYILATLVSQLEKGFTISPASAPLDGKLRLIHFGAMSGDEAMGLMKKAYDGGKHVDDEKVGYEEIEGLRIEFDEEDARWRRVCIDGKIIRVSKGGWMEVRPGVKGVVDLIAM